MRYLRDDRPHAIGPRPNASFASAGAVWRLTSFPRVALRFTPDYIPSAPLRLKSMPPIMSCHPGPVLAAKVG